MKRRFISAVLAAALIVMLISCDSVLDMMEKMGGNVSGIDTAKVEEAVTSMTVNEENQTKKEEITNKKTIDGKDVEKGTTFKYSDADGEEKELYTVGETKEEDGSTKNVIGIGDSLISIPIESHAKLSEIEAVLPPQDISAISENLTGSNKDELLKVLVTPVSDETTKKAAEGTKTVVQVLLEVADDRIDEDDENETSQKSKKLIEDVLTNMNNNEAEMTMGDVVVLQALTNLISEAPDAIAAVVKSTDSSSSAGETVDDATTKDAATKLLSDANDTIVATAEILNSVSSSTTLFEGIDLSSLLGLVISSEAGITEGN